MVSTLRLVLKMMLQAFSFRSLSQGLNDLKFEFQIVILKTILREWFAKDHRLLTQFQPKKMNHMWKCVLYQIDSPQMAGHVGWITSREMIK